MKYTMKKLMIQYNNLIKLEPKNLDLKTREDPKLGVFIQNISDHEVKSYEDIINLL